MVRILKDARPRPLPDGPADGQRRRGTRRARWITAVLAVLAVAGAVLAAESAGAGGYPAPDDVRQSVLRELSRVLAAAHVPGAHVYSVDDMACEDSDPSHGQLTINITLDKVTAAEAESVLAAARTVWASGGYEVTAGHFETDPAYASALDDQITANDGSYKLTATSLDGASVWMTGSSCYDEPIPEVPSQTVATLPAAPAAASRT